MKKTILLTLTLAIASSAYAAYWVDDPYDCPTSYQSQTCSGTTVVCGYNAPTTFCYEPASISPPSVMEATWSNDASASYNGGFLLDCYYYDGSAPMCVPTANDCDRNSTCYTTQHRYTNCTPNLWATSVCGNCYTNYLDCNADGGVCEVLVGTTDCTGGAHNNYATCATCQCDSGYTDCNLGGANATDGCETNTGAAECTGGAHNNYACVGTTGTCVCDTNYYDCDATGNSTGNGCEATNGGSCTVGGLAGTYTDASTCTCTIANQDIATTGVMVSWSGANMLWLHQYSPIGWIVNLTNASNSTAGFDANLCLHLPDGTQVCNSTDLGTGGGGNSTEEIQDATGLLATNTSTITMTYDDAANQLYCTTNSTYLNNTYYLNTNPSGFPNVTTPGTFLQTSNGSWINSIENDTAHDACSEISNCTPNALTYLNILTASFINYTLASSTFYNRTQIDGAGLLNYSGASTLFYNKTQIGNAGYLNYSGVYSAGLLNYTGVSAFDMNYTEANALFVNKSVSIPAGNISAGTFGSGTYTFPSNVTFTGNITTNTTVTGKLQVTRIQIGGGCIYATSDTMYINSTCT